MHSQPDVIAEQPAEQAPSDQVYVRCLNCGTDLTLPRSDNARRPFDPHCPKCGAELKLICEWCKKQYAPKLWRFGLDGLPKNRCCSEECQTLNWRAENPDWRKRHSKKPARHLRKCEECGREFPSIRSDARFCSKKCGNKNAHRENPGPYRKANLKYYRSHREDEIGRMKDWRDERKRKLAKADEAEQQLQEAGSKVAQLRKQLESAGLFQADLQDKLKVAEAQVGRLRTEQEGIVAKIGIAVNDAIPRFDRLFSTPEIEQNPRLLLGDWKHPDFTWDEMRAAREAIMGRSARRQRPMLAARWFVALTMNYDIATVRSYHNRYMKALKAA